MNLLDLTSCPLTGTNLIEASAGTGKTYTISYLYLRLLLERRLPVESILVVTFTEAATKELRSRIRGLIQSLLMTPVDPQNCDHITAHLLGLASPEDTTALLQAALRSFDQAAIFTIHGFCQRILQEHAFETGVRFDTELHTDSQGLLLSAVQDFWRDTFYGASPMLIQYMIKNKYDITTFARMANSLVGQPHVCFVPKSPEIEKSDLEEAFLHAFHQAQKCWQQEKESIQSMLLTWPDLIRRKYRKSTLYTFFRAADQFFTSVIAAPDLFDGCDRFSRSALAAESRNGNPPDHVFFAYMEQLLDASARLCAELDRYLLAVRLKAIPCIRKRLEQQKRRRNIHTFDDLLIVMLQALNGHGRQQLIQIVRNRYRAALIDEFQDTDSIQYAIFNALFSGTGRTLYLIGDPKQAIYSFRGADIFTYMQASRAADQRFTLGTNYRSQPGLIAAVNALFSGVDAPFVYDDDIPFEPVSPPQRQHRSPLIIEDEQNIPFHVWYFSSERLNYGKPVGKTAARPVIVDTVVAEIARLLVLSQQGKAHLGTRQLQPGDIAVLVSTKQEARQVKQALANANIPAVLQSAGNVFDTVEAHDLLRLLSAIAAPYDERKVRTALATSLIGYDGKRLLACMESEKEYEDVLEIFRSLHATWRARDFMSMITRCLHTYRIRKRLLSFSDGERRLTNLLHLIELLQQASVHRHLNTGQLIQWLGTQCDPSSPRLQEHELRLESDDDAVQLVTIHSSKGLEYPVVFCPFLWKTSFANNHMVLYHDDNLNQCCDMGSAEFEYNSARARKEELAENIRLLYVAVTRARCRCYIAWGRFYQTDSAAPAYIFHRGALDESSPDFVASLEKHVGSLDDQRRLHDIRERARLAKGTMVVTEIVQKPQVQQLTPSSSTMELLFCRRMSREDFAHPGLTSFSALTRQKKGDDHAADYDEETLSLPFLTLAEGEADQKERERSLFTFPRGAQAGTFFHALLEHVDFADKNPIKESELINQMLYQYGFDLHWHSVVQQLLDSVRNVMITTDRHTFALSSVSPDKRLNELEFHYPVKDISSTALSSIFTQFQNSPVTEGIPEAIGRLDFKPTRGYMHGFIDMVFTCEDTYYLLDWKSNFLGYTFHDYTTQALTHAMTEEYYFLQYYLYTLALDRYLTLRLSGYEYERNFGGVLYLFLRGISPSQGMKSGIFIDRPSNDIIDALRREIVS